MKDMAKGGVGGSKSFIVQVGFQPSSSIELVVSPVSPGCNPPYTVRLVGGGGVAAKLWVKTMVSQSAQRRQQACTLASTTMLSYKGCFDLGRFGKRVGWEKLGNKKIGAGCR